jgi:hypothetical protein
MDLRKEVDNNMMDVSHHALEKESAAVTLSDMEIYIFPELMQALALANIMSPLVWNWCQDPWFDGVNKLNPYRRLLRVKQFIMERYAFNLDLETWGLTTKTAETKRFANFIDADTLAQSNALFGYEGDKYYFSIDIRRHFGLDAYDADVIPYWKTETVEAMTAFSRKTGYQNGAGECVSLAALYYAALFVVAKIPLEKMFMLATPLHSQNFIDLNDGVLTNNRRIVTKKMWYNGMELSRKARRALENEQVTFVSTSRGYIHHLHPEATIDRALYNKFKQSLHNFLETKIDYMIFVSFLRQHPDKQSCFQFETMCGGKKRYIEAEKVFVYENSSSFRLGELTEDKLLSEVEEDDFYPTLIDKRVNLHQVRQDFEQIGKAVSLEEWESHRQLIFPDVHVICPQTEEVFRDFARFCRTLPRLPDENKTWQELPTLQIEGLQSGEQIREYLKSSIHPLARLALIAFRDINTSGWRPFLKAAYERNPVIFLASADMSLDEVYCQLQALPNVSIYPDEYRLAQPDEVWNFSTGDGLEKAVAMASIVFRRHGNRKFELLCHNDTWILKCQGGEYRFSSAKRITSVPNFE